MVDKVARKHDWGLLAIGVVFAGGGLYLALSGAGLAPSPSPLHGPNWLALAVGLVFFATGLSVLVRGWLAVPDNQPNLPAGTPAIFVAIQWLAAFVIIAGLASVATWIGFGDGDRHFSLSMPFGSSNAKITGGEAIGRAMFGLGAIITWLMAAGVAYAGLNKIFGKKS